LLLTWTWIVHLFSDQKLGQKISNVAGILAEAAGISLINFRKFGHNCRTRDARKSIKSSKDSYYSLEFNTTRVKKRRVWSTPKGWWPHRNVNRTRINILPSCKHQQNTDIQYWNNFFIASYKISPCLVGLKSSLTQPAGEVWPAIAMGIIYPGLAFVGVEFLPIFSLWAVVLAPDILERQSRPLQTHAIAYNLKILEPREWLAGLAPKPRLPQSQMYESMPPLWRHHKKTNLNKKNSLIKTRRLAESAEGLNNSLALSVVKLWLDKFIAILVALRSVKGWNVAECFLFSARTTLKHWRTTNSSSPK